MLRRPGAALWAAIIVAATVSACYQERGAAPSLAAPLPVAPDLVEEVRIDGYDEDLVPIGFAIPTVRAVAVAQDGRVALMQKQDRAIRVYHPSGQQAGTVGRDGQGPGEFKNLGALGWLGDTLWASDDELKRVSLFGPDLNLTRTIPIPTSLRMDRLVGSELDYPMPYLYIEQLLPGDTIYGRAEPSLDAHLLPDSLLGHRLFVRIVDGGVSGAIDAITGYVPVGDVQFEPMPGFQMTLPFPNRSVTGVAVSNSRTAFAVASVVGDSAGSFRVTTLSAWGETAFSRDYPFEPSYISPSERDSIVAASRRSFEGIVRLLEERAGTAGASTEQQFGVPVPVIRPPLEDLLVDREGRIWVEIKSMDESGARVYVVLSAEGHELRRLLFPPHMRVVEAEAETVWVLERDELGVESVTRYRMAAPRL